MPVQGFTNAASQVSRYIGLLQYRPNPCTGREPVLRVPQVRHFHHMRHTTGDNEHAERTKIQLKGRSRRLRTSHNNVDGIVKYAADIGNHMQPHEIPGSYM
jgi:hypothetical protein